MMLDLVDPGNFVSYNIAVANILGLNVSIYLSELIRISGKAVKKKALKNDFFLLDRNYVQSRTTFTPVQQKQIDETLIELGLMEKSKNQDEMKINIEALAKLFSSENKDLTKSIEKWIKIKERANKPTKTQATANGLKLYIKADNDEIREAYEGWIDGVFANPNGFLSKRSVEYFQTVVDNYCNHDLDLALNIITLATINGYRDPSWAIAAWEKDKSFNYRIYSYAYNKQASGPKEVAVGDEVF